MGRGQALLGAGDQNREPTVEGEKRHRTQDGQRDGLVQREAGGVSMREKHKLRREIPSPISCPSQVAEPF